MVFFKNKTVLINSSNKEYRANVQPMSNKLKIDTFGEDTKSQKIMFIDELCEEGWLITIDNEKYLIEKSLQYDSHSECAILKL